ncbi:hypothetical protein [Paraburkholderia hospita]|uniref:hypothetical protein n=1 Tax=Paraburkholderia hospita TaxID=169430 RepID=UPI001F617E20|nr:hypothetical protein [Paraburkholderia hospita]
MERMALRAELSGARGGNRALTFSQIRAHNDLKALRAWLYMCEDQPKTLRAYTREVERFLLWAVCVRGRGVKRPNGRGPLGLQGFSESAVGRVRGSAREPCRRPLAPVCVRRNAPGSQKYAVRTLRAAFEWLVHVRYLASNPWKAVKDPVVVEREHDMKIERALTASLWDRARR